MKEVFKCMQNEDGSFSIYVNGVLLEEIRNKAEFVALWNSLKNWHSFESTECLENFLPSIDNDNLGINAKPIIEPPSIPE